MRHPGATAAASPRSSDRLPLLVLLAAATYVLRWSLSPNNYFFADDWNWLYSAATHQASAWFFIFPFQLYNDRPVGALFIKALYHLFGLNHVAFHAAYLALHLFNVALAFFIAKRLGRLDKIAFCSAILFGCWGSALRPYLGRGRL